MNCEAFDATDVVLCMQYYLFIVNSNGQNQIHVLNINITTCEYAKKKSVI